MSAVAVVEGLSEGLTLLTNLLSAASTVSAAVQKAQATGQPVDLASILSEEAAAENDVIAAIAAAKARGQ